MAKNKFQLSKFENNFFCDFETRGEENFIVDGEVSVFMWELKDIHGNASQGTTMKQFINHVKLISRGEKIVIWFHNLNFDFSFIEHFLLFFNQAGYKEKLEKYYIKNTWGKEYTTTRDDMGNLYSVLWFTAKESSVTFYDSAKIFPMSLKKLGNMVNVSKLAEQFDYTKYRPQNYRPSKEEWEYLDHDTEIVRMAMLGVFERYGKVRMTRSSYAFNGLKDTFNEVHTPDDWKDQLKDLGYEKAVKYFDYCFPGTEPDEYDFLKNAYAGGIVYYKESIRNKLMHNVRVYDVNSEYPAAMLKNMYPIGNGVKFSGNYQVNNDSVKKAYPLYVQKFKCRFKLKPGGFPMLPKKYGIGKKTIYNSSQLKSRDFVMALCNVDLLHFLKNYDVEPGSWVFMGGMMWEQIEAPFKEFIKTCMDGKVSAQEAGDMLAREMYKLDANGCYGKFAQRPDRAGKGSRIDDNGVVRHDILEEADAEAKNYFPMAIFITAYAREILLNGIYAVGIDRVLYVDTDSIHILGWDEPKGLPIHESEPGFWGPDGGLIENGKKSGKYITGKYLRDKMYIEQYHDENGEIKNVVKGAGLSDKARGEIKNPDDYILARYYDNNIQKTTVKGGTLLRGVNKFIGVDENVADADELKRTADYINSAKQRKTDKYRDALLEKEALIKSLEENGIIV